MKAGTARTIGAICAIIMVSIAVASLLAGLVWRIARLETKVDAVYAKVEDIEGWIHGTADTPDVARGGGTDGNRAAVFGRQR